MRAYLFEDDDGDVISDIATWDILNFCWISGRRGLLWGCHHRKASIEDVMDQYPTDMNGKKFDLITSKDGKTLDGIDIYDVWNSKQEGVIIDGEYVYKHEHNIGHPPIFILPVGSVPLIQSERFDDTIKDVGTDFTVNNREIYKVQSRIDTYFLELTGRAAKNPVVAEYDSTKGGKPIDFGVAPNQKGAVIPMDIGKGQRLIGGVTPEMTRDAYAFRQEIARELSDGGMAPVSFGTGPFPDTAQGTNILVHASLTNIHPFVRTIERGYEWLATEFVSQWKSGKFGKIKLRGVDGSNRRFEIEPKPDDIDDSWQFKAQLIIDMPQDEMANVGMAVQVVEAGLLSIEEASEKYHLSMDTDLTQQKIDRAKVYDITLIKMKRVAAALIKDGREEEAQDILDDIERVRNAQVQEKQKGVASQPGVTRPVRPSADTSAVTAQPGIIQKFAQRNPQEGQR